MDLHNCQHIAGLIATLDAAARAPTRYGQRVRCRNDHDLVGTDMGPARRVGERLVLWDGHEDVGPYTIGANQIEGAE